jgi:hypothetical protein
LDFKFNLYRYDVEGLGFTPEMLAWEPGARPEIDGVWAPWWYKNIHASGGFEPLCPKPPAPLPDAIRRLVEEARPFYYLLRRHALTPLAADECGGAGVGGGGGVGGLQVSGSGSGGGSGGGGDGKRRRVDGDGGGGGGAAAIASTSQKKKGGTHAYAADPRNADVLIGVRDGVRDAFELVWRPEAKVSVFDAGFVLGDGVGQQVEFSCPPTA